MPTPILYRVTRTLVLGLLSLLLSGCLVLSEQPLSAPDLQSIDPALVGIWQLRDTDGGTITVHIGRENSVYCHPCAHALVYIEQHADGRLSGDSYQGFVSSLGKAQWLNLRFRDPDRIVEGYVFMRYELTGPDQLAVRIIDPDKLAKLVADKRLPGTLNDDGSGPAVQLTANTATLAAFFGGSSAESVLGPAQTFRRLESASQAK